MGFFLLLFINCMKFHSLNYLVFYFFLFLIPAFASLPSPPDVWKDFDPDAGNFKEEIIYEKTVNGIYEKHAYISAYVNEVEIRVFCKYAVKEGAKKAPGLMNTHGWMGGPSIDMQYVKDGWAVISHDYSGLSNRPLPRK